MDLLQVKILTMFLLGGVSLLVGLLPLILRRWFQFFERESSTKKGGNVLSGFLCYGGGIILSTCFTHMLPEVNTVLKFNMEQGLFPDTGMNVAELFVLCGFFMVYILEEVAHLVIDRFFMKRKTNAAVQKKMDNENQNEAQVSLTMPINHNHTHSHDVEMPMGPVTLDSDSFQATMRGLLVILALSLHAVFEGIAIGLAYSPLSVWYLFGAIAAHKYVISLCIGMQFVSSGIKAYVTVIYVATFSFISPIGAGVGMALFGTATTETALQTSVVTLLQGIATGTLLYVVFFEIIEKERQKGTNGLLVVFFLMLGAGTMTLVQYIEVVSAS